MSIRLIQPIFLDGVLSPVNSSTLSLADALEADLVNQGKAVWVVPPRITNSGNSQHVTAQIDPVSGRIDQLSVGGISSSYPQPSGMPILIIGGDHPYKQWYGSNGRDGLARWYNDSGITPYIAINTDPVSNTNPGGNNQMSWEELKSLANVEIVAHGHRHYQDNAAPTVGITVTYTGAAATATFRVAGGNAVGATAGAVNDFSLSLATYTTITTLLAAINAVTGWSATLSASELLGTEPSAYFLTGAAISAKAVNCYWPCGGALRVSYSGSTYNDICLTNDGTNLRLFGNGVLITAIALSGSLSAMVTALNAISGITAALAGSTTNPNYISGTEDGTNIRSWTGPLWLSAVPVAIDAGLSSGYMRYRNNKKNIEEAAANGVTLTEFAQSGGYCYEYCADTGLFGVSRGNNHKYLVAQPTCFLNDFTPHVALNQTDFSVGARVPALIDALADSPGFTMVMLCHNLRPDAGISGYQLPTTTPGSYDQTETDWITTLNTANAHISAGNIRPCRLNDLRFADQARPPKNYFFNPRFRNSGEALNTANIYVVPGWSLSSTGIGTASISGGVFTLPITSSSQLQPLSQQMMIPPGTWEMSADIEIEGYTTGNGVFLYCGRLDGAEMDNLSGETFRSGLAIKSFSRLRTVFELLPNAAKPAYIRSPAQPWNLSVNKNIWLRIDGVATIDNLDCSAGAASSAAVTAKEVAAAINAAIAANASYPAEYHTCAKAVGGRVIITSPYNGGYPSDYVEIRAASTLSATAVLFGNAGNHYGYPRQSSGDWRANPVVFGFGILLANSATVKIARPLLRLLTNAVR